MAFLSKPSSIACLAFALQATSVMAQPGESAESDPVLEAMAQELSRARKELRIEGQPVPYFISFWLQERANIHLQGKNGGLAGQHPEFHPSAEAGVEIRVGDYSFDNTDVSRERESPFGDDSDDAWPLWQMAQAPLGDALGIRSIFWLLGDRAFKQALSDYAKKKGEASRSPREQIPDFMKAAPVQALSPRVDSGVDIERWRRSTVKLSRDLAAYPHVLDATVEFTIGRFVDYLLNTEGTSLRNGSIFYRVELSGKTMSEDGILLDSFRSYAVREPAELPSEATLSRDIKDLAAELNGLRNAQELVSYTGPAILDGDVAGVFLHEALGHRLEGERQRRPQEGQTFKDKLGQKILPPFISVVDDPTLARHEGQTLNGTYSHDNEGIPAERVILVEKGILKNYLLSRTPIKGFERSNGHGRAEAPTSWRGFQKPVGRMGNLMLVSEKKTPFLKLRQRLIEEARRQGRDFGVIIRRARSGETSTEAGGSYFGAGFQAWRTRPVLVYTVDVKTGKETLVRGAELVGTPLTSIEKILDAGDKATVFNGHCGAESGSVPVSTIAPAILTAQIELQRIGGMPKKPPILSSPFQER